MTHSERQRCKAETLLFAARERYNDVRRGLEAERDRLLTKGSPIHSPFWRRGSLFGTGGGGSSEPDQEPCVLSFQAKHRR
jgi:hypothetical protein